MFQHFKFHLYYHALHRKVQKNATTNIKEKSKFWKSTNSQQVEYFTLSLNSLTSCSGLLISSTFLFFPPCWPNSNWVFLVSAIDSSLCFLFFNITSDIYAISSGSASAITNIFILYPPCPIEKRKKMKPPIHLKSHKTIKLASPPFLRWSKHDTEFQTTETGTPTSNTYADNCIS